MLALLLFVGLPILEILLFIQAGGAFGFWPIVVALFGTAIVGLIMVRHQGIITLRAVEKEHAEGKVPVGALFHGVRLAMAGILLLLPGFITDTFGLLLLIPGMLQGIAKVIGASGDFRFGNHYRTCYGTGSQGDIIDGDYEAVMEPNPMASGNKRDSALADSEMIIALPDGSSRPASNPHVAPLETPPPRGSGASGGTTGC